MRLIADIRYSAAGDLEVRYYDGFLANSRGGLGVGQAVLTGWISVGSPPAPPAADLTALFDAVKLSGTIVAELEAAANA